MVKQCSIIFACLLQKKVDNIESVKGISQFLVSNMGFFFVPPGVAIMLYFDIISAQWFPIVTATLLSIAIVLIVTGWVHQFVNSHKCKFRSKH